MIPLSSVTTLLLSTLGLNGAIWPQQATLTNNSHFDYIIIGGGTAGCAVASRLAEDKNSTVLLLEAGGDPPVTALLPALFALLPATNVDYDYYSTFDDFAAGGQDNFTKLTAGKMLGGSASLNHFINMRGIPRDFDEWAEITGDDSWRYENVLQYFIKSENVYDKELVSMFPEYHGTEGPMGITIGGDDKELANYFKSFAEAGNPEVTDLNANQTMGYMKPQYMLAKGIRQTPAYSYLKPIKDNPNLYVSKNTVVSKIVFENNVAVAVEAIYKDKTYTFGANKEVILSAGVFSTPQILMLSGIGPQDHLKALGINVIADLPVGDNLDDQVAISLVHKTKRYLLPIANPLKVLSALPPTKIPFPVLVGSVALNKSETIPDYSVFNLLFQHDVPLLTLACSFVFRYRNEICTRWQEQVISRDSLFSFLIYLQPKSRGTVRLNSTNPFDNPVIKTNYFENDEDLENMVKYVKDFITVGDTTWFKSVGAALVGLDLPECADKEIGTDEYWKCYILNHALTSYHSASTCPMGTVVDGTLKVKGMKRLRIVDASVIPKQPHGAVNAAVVMLAEKAADMIKNGI